MQDGGTCRLSRTPQAGSDGATGSRGPPGPPPDPGQLPELLRLNETGRLNQGAICGLVRAVDWSTKGAQIGRVGDKVGPVFLPALAACGLQG
ncbi:thymidine phosphorylase isoform X3 [Mustela erminea]|uniref:thymidine phosphorylase isoform X3 n=1 Tax=Mustela erminea TaxID=36723 RepID=UPI0013870091|nr:thymidine phosphorylase isoform X3 [Mustela erminea]